MDTEKLQAYLLSLYPLSIQELDILWEGWQPISVNRKTILTTAGEKEKYLYFVLEGVQRAFYLGDNQKEATVVFTYAHSFSGVADSLLTQTPSLYFLETLTKSRFLRIPAEIIQNRIAEHPGIRTLFFNATAFALRGALERHIELQCYTNEEKFKTLLHRSPHILQLVPHKYLASYLGMDPTNFSKLLASVRL